MDFPLNGCRSKGSVTMHRSRGKCLPRIVMLFICVLITMWYFAPSYKKLYRHPIVRFEGSRLPSGMLTYLKELKAIPVGVKYKTPGATKKPRILCLILTKPDNLHTNVAVVNTTWVSRCHKHFFVLNSTWINYDIINTPYEEVRSNLIHKVRHAFKFLYTKHINDFDWILKADDDTYVIMENLQFLLSHYDSSKSGYLGFHFAKMAAKNGFMSGGAGYVISNRALRRLIEFGFNNDACPVIPTLDDPESSEDIEIGRCLNVSGVSVLSSIDAVGRETFHPYPLQQYLISNHLPPYMYERAINFPRLGLDCCSEYSISFHYMSHEAMLVVDHLLYRTSVYGRDVLTDTGEKRPVFQIGKVNIDEKLAQLHNRTENQFV